MAGLSFSLYFDNTHLHFGQHRTVLRGVKRSSFIALAVCGPHSLRVAKGFCGGKFEKHTDLLASKYSFTIDIVY